MSDWLPDAADTRSLGSTTREWLNVYIGDAGKMYFGLAQDVNLYRSAANILKTDNEFRAIHATIDTLGGGVAYTVHTGHNIGFLGRDDNFIAGIDRGLEFRDITNGITRLYFSYGGIIYFGSDADVNLYRSAANILKTDDAFSAVGSVDGVSLFLSAAILFGDDVNLYRSAANLLKTDDTLQAAGYNSSDGTSGAAGTITLAAITTITVKNGLITAWS